MLYARLASSTCPKKNAVSVSKVSKVSQLLAYDMRPRELCQTLNVWLKLALRPRHVQLSILDGKTKPAFNKF